MTFVSYFHWNGSKGGWAKGIKVKVIKRYKPLVIKELSQKIITHSTRSILNNIIITLSGVFVVLQSGPTFCDPLDCGMPGFPVLHHLPEFSQTHVHWVSDAIQPSHPLLPPSPPAFSLSQHHGLLQRVSSSHQVAKVLELQLQHQSFQWIFRVDFL